MGNKSPTRPAVRSTQWNFYVADDFNGDVSEFSPDGTLEGGSATGLANPFSLVFDNQGDLYVGQQSTPYIAEFNTTGQFVPDIGPVETELFGDDWIVLAPDQCTFDYTTESTDILRYNMCTNPHLPNFNLQSFPTVPPIDRPARSGLRAPDPPDGDVLVADSNADFLLDPNGNVIQPCACAIDARLSGLSLRHRA